MLHLFPFDMENPEHKKLRIVSVNHSAGSAEKKKPVPFIRVDERGVEGDGDRLFFNHELSLLGIQAYQGMEENYGFWAENLTTDGLDLSLLKPMDCLVNDEARLKVTITAKNVKSEQRVAFNQGGPRDIPVGGLFAQARKPAILKAGMEFTYKPMIFHTRILTLSDRASKGIYEDKSGEIIREMIGDFFEKADRRFTIDKYIIPDEKDPLETHFFEALADKVDILITKGGTGIGERDITPDVIRPLLEKEIPGIMELIRVKYGTLKPNALVSRSLAGVREKTLVYCLPGSTKGVNERNPAYPFSFHVYAEEYSIALRVRNFLRNRFDRKVPAMNIHMQDGSLGK